MTGHRIAFVTCSDLPDLQPDDTPAAAWLSERGIIVEAAVWSDSRIDWSRFDAVVLRSTWDYHLRASEFLSWIDAMDRRSAPVWNPANVVRWNADKRYLTDLSAAGVTVVPTVGIERGRPVRLVSLLEDRNWSRAVVKPSVSGGAYRTWVADRSALADSEQRLAELLESSDALVQPFLFEIEKEGEWSLVFLDGAFSHAVLKHPAAGDFRVQEEFGGFAESVPAPEALIAAAERALSSVPGPTLYARVDGCLVDGVFQLLELELIEPSLFLDKDSRAASRFGEAIARRLM